MFFYVQKDISFYFARKPLCFGRAKDVSVTSIFLLELDATSRCCLNLIDCID